MAKTHAIIRVAVVDDDPIVRNGMQEMLDQSKGFCCVGTFATGEEALEKIPSLKPDVVLMDIQLPGISGITCISNLAALLPDLEIMMLTVFEDTDRIMRSIRAGATGYILKSASHTALREAICQLHEGGSPITPEIARRIVEDCQQLNTQTQKAAMASLSPREREVLTEMARGLLHKQIAAKLGISIETIRTHTHNIYDKLKVGTKTEAVMKVFGAGVP